MCEDPFLELGYSAGNKEVKYLPSWILHSSVFLCVCVGGVAREGVQNIENTDIQ